MSWRRPKSVYFDSDKQLVATMRDGKPVILPMTDERLAEETYREMERLANLSEEERQREWAESIAASRWTPKFLGMLRSVQPHQKIALGVAAAILFVSLLPPVLMWRAGYSIGVPQNVSKWARILLDGTVAAGIVLLVGFWPRATHSPKNNDPVGSESEPRDTPPR